MSAKYEFWLTDDAGRRMLLLKDFAFSSYSRSTRGLGTILFGLPLKVYLSYVPTIFQPDWRIDVWRSAANGVPKRRESSYLLRKYRVYDREEDSMRMIEFFGRSPLDILRRGAVSNTVAAQYKKTDYIDDMMKAIVTDVFITGGQCVPAGEFSVEGDLSLGPSITQEFKGKNVRDVLTDLKATSFSLNHADSTKRRIFFDVVEGLGLDNGFGYTFRTYADLRGIDRTNGTVFSPENGNLIDTEYFENYLDEITVAEVGVTTVTSPDALLSRWNSIKEYRAASTPDVSIDTSTANQMLSEDGKKISIGAYFVNSPGSSDQPRSLYGIDWDLGDLLPVQYAGKNLQAEVEIVWVSVNDMGVENIVGSNRVGE